MESVSKPVPTKRRRPIPISLKMMRLAIRLLDSISPALTSRWLYRLWFRTQKHNLPERERDWLQQASESLRETPYGPVTVYSWGQGPTVLLVHGWSGRALQLGAFAQPLVDAGYRVLAFDAPAHGKSPGKQTNIFQVIDSLHRVIEGAGPLHAIISHSFGAMVTARALATGLEVARVVCISPPAATDFLIDRFCQVLQVPDASKQLLIRRIDDRFGEDTRAIISTEFNARVLSIPALIIHDKKDHDVPWQQAQRVASAWQGSRLHLTEGLGHRRILRADSVVKLTVEFITQT